MTRPLSNDLRRRVVTAVADGGMSRRGAARRFGIAPSTAIKWVSAWRRTGSYRPRAQGGDRPSQRIETRAEVVLALVEESRGVSINDLVISTGLNVKLDPAQTDAPALALSEGEQRRLLDRVERLLIGP